MVSCIGLIIAPQLHSVVNLQFNFTFFFLRERERERKEHQLLGAFTRVCYKNKAYMYFLKGLVQLFYFESKAMRFEGFHHY